MNTSDLFYLFPRGNNRLRTIADILGLNLNYNYQKIFVENLLGNFDPYEIPVRINGEVIGKYKIDTSSIYGFQPGQLYIDENTTAKSFLGYKTRSFSIRSIPFQKELNLNMNDTNYKLSREILLNIPKISIPCEGKFKLNEDMKGDKKNEFIRKRSR